MEDTIPTFIFIQHLCKCIRKYMHSFYIKQKQLNAKKFVSYERNIDLMWYFTNYLKGENNE
jgi:hypothetical protein